MKLLFDENLSFRLVKKLADVFPESAHVHQVGLTHSEDLAVWRFAEANGFCIVSKDEDFHQRSFLHGQPPKVICSTRDCEEILRANLEAIAEFRANTQTAFLALA